MTDKILAGNEPRHTPGPWHVGRCAAHLDDEGGNCLGIRDANHDPIVSLRSDTKHADARLIAAAPALLAALRILADEQNGPPLERRRPQWEAAMTNARSALAVALGDDAAAPREVPK